MSPGKLHGARCTVNEISQSLGRRPCTFEVIKDFWIEGLEQNSTNHASLDGWKVDFRTFDIFKRVGSEKSDMASERKLKESASHHKGCCGPKSGVGTEWPSSFQVSPS